MHEFGADTNIDVSDCYHREAVTADDDSALFSSASLDDNTEHVFFMLILGSHWSGCIADKGSGVATLTNKLNSLGRLNSTEYQTLDGLMLSQKPLNGSHTYYEIHASGAPGGLTLPNTYRRTAIDSKKQMDSTSEDGSNYFSSDGPISATDEPLTGNMHCGSGTPFTRQQQTVMMSGSTPVTPLTQRRALQPAHFNPYSEASFV